MCAWRATCNRPARARPQRVVHIRYSCFPRLFSVSNTPVCVSATQISRYYGDVFSDQRTTQPRRYHDRFLHNLLISQDRICSYFLQLHRQHGCQWRDMYKCQFRSSSAVCFRTCLCHHERFHFFSSGSPTCVLPCRLCKVQTNLIFEGNTRRLNKSA